MTAGDRPEAGDGYKGSPVVGYIRSARLGDPTLDEWEEGVRRYAAEHGYYLVDVVRDEGVSGVAVWKPGVERVIRGVEKGEFVGVIIPALQHLASSTTLVNRVRSRIEQPGGWVEIVSASPEPQTA